MKSSTYLKRMIDTDINLKTCFEFAFKELAVFCGGFIGLIMFLYTIMDMTAAGAAPYTIAFFGFASFVVIMGFIPWWAKEDKKLIDCTPEELMEGLTIFVLFMAMFSMLVYASNIVVAV